MATAISFNSNNLQTSSIITSSIDHESVADRNVAFHELAHGNRSFIPYTSYPSKRIRLTGTIYSTSIAGLDTLLDTFRAYFTGKDKNLDVGYGGSTRRYIATAKDVIIRRPIGLNHALFDVELYTTEPFGRDTSSTSAKSVNGVTSTPYSSNFTLAGTAPLQWPIITIDINSLTDGTNKEITFSNDENGQAVTITRTWLADDLIVINTDTKIITVNGTEVDYTGAVPEFSPGTFDFTISHSLTAINYDYDIDYFKRYM